MNSPRPQRHLLERLKPIALLPSLLALTLALSTRRVDAQLAITEVMSSELLPSGTDYWELTNYGDSPVDLSNYTFNDLLQNNPPTSQPFTHLIIQPHQSVVFVEQKTGVTDSMFRQWWGLGSSVPVVFYTGHGLASTGDGIFVW